MKITRLSSGIKVLGLFRGLSFLLCAGAWTAACAPVVAQAPFPARADTVEPGDLLGPFSGRVVDAATGKPVSGAVVYAAWGFETGHGLTAPAGSSATSVETDSDGHYEIPHLEALPGGRTRIQRFTLLVYKRGFITYRSDRRFEDFSVRHDFSQSNNLAKLDRVAPGLSHIKHVRFAGGGGALRRAMAGEIVQASLELGGAASVEPGQPQKPPLDASPLLSLDELRAVTSFEGDFTVERLADLPQTSTYDSKHFRATGKAESFDAAIRVWKLSTPDAAEARYATLLKEVPHAEPRDEVGDQSMRGHDGKILAAATLDKEHGLVIELTCGVELCRDGDQAVALVRRVLARAQRIGVAEEGEKAEPEKIEKTEPETKPEPKEPENDNPFRLRPPELKHR